MSKAYFAISVTAGNERSRFSKKTFAFAERSTIEANAPLSPVTIMPTVSTAAPEIQLKAPTMSLYTSVATATKVALMALKVSMT